MSFAGKKLIEFNNSKNMWKFREVEPAMFFKYALYRTEKSQ